MSLFPHDCRLFRKKCVPLHLVIINQNEYGNSKTVPLQGNADTFRRRCRALRDGDRESRQRFGSRASGSGRRLRIPAQHSHIPHALSDLPSRLAVWPLPRGIRANTLALCSSVPSAKCYCAALPSEPAVSSPSMPSLPNARSTRVTASVCSSTRRKSLPMPTQYPCILI